MLCALRKVDPDNDLWLDAQFEQIESMKLDKSEEDRRLREIEDAFKTNEADYGRKLGIIQNSVYGVDIQPVAIEIAKLRFFLTLIVDEKIDDNEDNRGILPLPNLDFKFVCANSLISAPEIEYQGDELDLEYYPDFFKDFTRLTEHYFYAGTPAEKKRIRDELTVCVGKKIHGELDKVHELQGIDLFAMEGLSKAKQKKIKDRRAMLVRNIRLWESYKNIFSGATVDFFDPQYMFPDAGGGFDVVIGNPPYVQLQNDGGKLAELYENAGFETFARTGDIYCLFYERGQRLLKAGGHLCYITSNKWMRAGYGKATRHFFSEQTQPVLLIDFAGQKIFESATVDTNILIFQRKTDADANAAEDVTALAVTATAECRIDLSLFVRQYAVPTRFDGENSWVILSPIEQSIKSKIEAIGVPLKDWDIAINYGIKTGYNEAFIIDAAKRSEILAQCKTEEERRQTDELIRPILRGRDVKRYEYVFADIYLIAAHNGYNDPDGKWTPRIDMNDYPAVKQHLASFEPRLSSRADQGDTPYNLRSCAYMNDFSKPKIMWAETMRIRKENAERFPRFSYTTDDVFTDKTCFISVGSDLKILLAFLNSTIGRYQFSQTVAMMDNGGYLMQKIYVEKIRACDLTKKQSSEIITLVDTLLKATNNKSNEPVEEQIDSIIFDLFGITTSEQNYLRDMLSKPLDGR